MQCELAIKAGFEYAIEYIHTEVTPERACIFSGSCAGDVGIVDLADKDVSFLKSNPDPADQCVACKFAVETLHHALMADSTKSKILSEAANLCSKLGDELSGPCTDVIKKNGPDALNLAVQYLADSQALCVDFGSCPATAALGEHMRKRALILEMMKNVEKSKLVTV